MIVNLAILNGPRKGFTITLVSGDRCILSFLGGSKTTLVLLSFDRALDTDCKSPARLYFIFLKHSQSAVTLASI